MKKYTFILLTLSLMVFTSCLRHGLEELPVFEDKDIASVQRVEYRFIGDRVSGASGQPIVETVTLNQSPAAVINKEQGTVKISLVVPNVNNTFTQKHRDECSTKNIVVAVGISTAARIQPIEGSPKLGVPGDWSKPNKYEVIAADGSKKTWTLEIIKFEKN